MIQFKLFKNAFQKSLYVSISVVFIIITFAIGVEQLQAQISVGSLINCTNYIREDQGVENLKVNSLLKLAAEQKVKDMNKYKYWAHQNPKTKDFTWKFIKEAGYDYHRAGENLAIGFTLGQSICDAWENSPSHRDNLINPHYQDVGFASMEVNLGSEKGVLVVQLLGSKKEDEKSNDFISASLFDEKKQKTGCFLFLLISLVFCKIGLRFLRRLES
jgi:uncharacterized protein YkwD